MSEYQVLARKYRPKNFSQLVGQAHVSLALSNAIDAGRLHHAYLFTGTRGVGKTTIARILAKCLNCETGMTSTPCGVCDTCVSVDSGRFIDLIEIDAASRTKVEDTRELLENVPYAPVQGRYKVYLIDEVHMLSTHSFNALLKTLEEPPEHVKFILATTDPQKLPITIVSRCLQFVLRPLSQELLHGHLTHILHTEQIAFDDTAIWQLAQSAKGSVRDALSLTDQAIAFGGGQVQSHTVMEMLGLVDGIDVLDLIDDIYHDRRTKVAHHIARLRSQMVDATAMLDRLVDSFHTMALVQVLPDVPLDMNDEQKQVFFGLAHTLAPDVIQLYYEIAIKARDSIRLASTPMQALEMGILRLLAFRPLMEDEIITTKTSLTPMIDVALENTSTSNVAHRQDAISINQPESIEIENQEIENQEIENQEIENQEIENQEIENQEIVWTNGSILPTNAEQLKQQLSPTVATLDDEWTPDKWDYWLSQAREKQLLSTDELALAKHAMMVGRTDGECRLLVSDINQQIMTSYTGFGSKFRQAFPNCQLAQKPYLFDEQHQVDKADVPAVRQQKRQMQVLEQVQNQLLSSPVLQKLWQEGYIDEDVAAISNTKLLFD